MDQPRSAARYPITAFHTAALPPQPNFPGWHAHPVVHASDQVATVSSEVSSFAKEVISEGLEDDDGEPTCVAADHWSS